MPSDFRATAILGHWTSRLRGEVKARCDCPARVALGRLDSGLTGGVFPAHPEAGIAAPPHLKPGSEAGSGPISVLEG